MKTTLLIILLGITSVLTKAQSREGTLEYLKTTQPAAVIEYPYKEELVEGAIREQFEKQGSKISTSKGIMIVKGARLENNSTGDLMDLYFQVERKSRKDKETTLVYLAAGHPGENITARAAQDRYGVAEAQAYLNSLMPVIDNYSVGLQVIEQEELIKKADKKYAGLVSDSVDYQKKKLALEQKIAENSQAQQSQRVELERQRQILEALKARRKP